MALIAGAVWHPIAARADSNRFSLIEEDDGLLPDAWDRHYTQGAMLSVLSTKQQASDLTEPIFNFLSMELPIFQAGSDISRRFDIVTGQSLFTPVKWHDPIPDPQDRPFAGWLYAGGSLLQETNGNMLENFEVLGGIVGPDALGRETVNWFHSLIGSSLLTQGWKYQLANEPGFAISYERKWRFGQNSLFGLQTDVIPEAGLTAGNVFTYAESGVLFRIGQNLAVDYGVPSIRPSLSGTSWFDPSRMESPFGWYLFAGIQGRAVAHNMFLDGNTFENSRSVQQNIFVADLDAGVSLFYSDWIKLDFSVTERSKEFATQKQWDHFGRFSLSVLF